MCCCVVYVDISFINLTVLEWHARKACLKSVREVHASFFNSSSAAFLFGLADE